MSKLESLDYRTPDNLPLREFQQTGNSRTREVQRLIAKWLLFMLIGLLTGGAAYAIRRAIDELQALKFMAVKIYMHTSPVTAFFIYLAIVGGYGVAACLVVLALGPLSGGSGIPQLKGFLNGVRIEGFASLKTFVGKIISIIFAYSSCLALGPEGPMVHIGAIIASGLSSGKSRSLGIRLPKVFERLRVDKEQRDFISSGAAAGISAAFGAPIGGLLFSLEEAASFWSRELTWRTFFGSMTAAFTVNACRHIAESNLINDYGLFSFGASKVSLYRYEETFAFILVGVVAGLLGALFVRLNMKINLWRRNWLNPKGRLAGLLELLAIVTVSAVLNFWLPAVLSCKPKSGVQTVSDVCDPVSSDVELFGYFCPPASDAAVLNATGVPVDPTDFPSLEYNELANLFFVPQDRALKFLFSRNLNMFTLPSLFIFLVVYFLLVTWTAGSKVAAGLFVPMMLIGATYGRIIGNLISLIFPSANPPIDPSIYSLVGAAAMMGGFSRTTISLAVIMVELTENTQFLLPIMIAVMFAKWIGDALSKSIYDELMELSSITFLEHHPPKFTQNLGVQDVMTSDPVCVNERESVARIVEILSTTHHNGFPVIRNLGDERTRSYRGLILRKELLILLYHQLWTKDDPSAVDRDVPAIEYLKYIALKNQKWNLEMVQSRLPRREEQPICIVDLYPYMDKSHSIVTDSWSFMDAYRTFQALGLRHIPVVDDNFQVVGILTRHDLTVYYHGEDHVNRPAE